MVTIFAIFYACLSCFYCSSMQVKSEECFFCCDSLEINESRCISENEFEGVILKSKKQLKYIKSDSANFIVDSVWSVQYSDIMEFENFVEKEFKLYYKDSLGELYDVNIFPLKKYLRQYVGLYNPTGERIILVSFSLFFSKYNFHKYYRDRFVNEFFVINDGEFSYFTLLYNFKSSKIINFRKNTSP